MALNKYYLTLDLVNDAALIAEYKLIHQQVSPEIIKSIKDADITVMDIYCVGNRMFMIIEAGDDFSFEKKTAMDADNETVQKWESFMWKFQQTVPWAKPGEKWVLMEKIFGLP